MSLLWQVIRWETGRHLRNKQFLIGLFITPVIFALFAGVPSLLNRFDKPQQFTYMAVDSVNAVPFLQERLAGTEVSVEAYSGDVEALAEQVRAGDIDGYFVLDASFIETGRLPIYMEKVQMRPGQLDSALTEYFQLERLQERNIDAELLAYVSTPPMLVSTALETQGQNSVGNLPMAIGFSGLLFFLVMGSGSMLLMSALQEKRDRMSEVVLSSVGPDTLMGGKIIAHFFLGIFQILFWLAIGLPIAYFVLDIPLGDYITPSLIPLYTLFTLMGYLLFAALFVGMGATMENMESASNSQGMVFMLPMLSFFVIGPVIGNPDGTIARIATLFPITSPIITVMRTGFTTIPTWELLASIAILLVTTVIIVKVTAKVFRTGMLMYGKNPNLRELWKWMRQA